MSVSLPRRAIIAGAAAAAALPVGARAQGWTGVWPAGPIRLIVPFAPGGTTDLVARLVAGGLQERLGQPLIVENRPGAGATLGSQQVAAAAPDGQTLLMSNSASHAIAPSLYRNLRYDAVRDFAHVALVVQNPSVFVATPRFPARNLGEVVRHALEGRRGIDIASSGSGSSNHLLIVQFGEVTGAPVNHIPYRGAGPAMTDVIAGTVPMMSDSLPSAVAHIRGGAVRAIAISSEDRHPAFPDLPTFREQGVNLVSNSWFGLSAPAGTPAPIVERLNREVRAVLGTPAMRARFAEMGGSVADLGPEAFTAFLHDEVVRWAPVVRASGAQVD
jgi:tripartite-type tricarboxylate transporter receptor subunit TctC